MEATTDSTAGGARTGRGWIHRAAIIGAIVAYALVAARCRPLTIPATVAVLAAGVPLFWSGVRHRPQRAEPAGRRSAIVWLTVGGLAAAYELGLWLGPDDLAHPTFSTLADPVLSTYPGRVAGYLLWAGAGVWLVSR